jgi:hypothetical protein
MAKEIKTNKVKMTQEIEENCWRYLEEGLLTQCYEYLKELGFTDEDIDFFLEVWREGKSLYPYKQISF